MRWTQFHFSSPFMNDQCPIEIYHSGKSKSWRIINEKCWLKFNWPREPFFHCVLCFVFFSLSFLQFFQIHFFFFSPSRLSATTVLCFMVQAFFILFHPFIISYLSSIINYTLFLVFFFFYFAFLFTFDFLECERCERTVYCLCMRVILILLFRHRSCFHLRRF